MKIIGLSLLLIRYLWFFFSQWGALAFSEIVILDVCKYLDIDSSLGAHRVKERERGLIGLVLIVAQVPTLIQIKRGKGIIIQTFKGKQNNEYIDHRLETNKN